MGTTADKLAYIEGTKTSIREAITAKGGSVPDGTVFRDYADKILAISTIPELSDPGTAPDLLFGKQLVGGDGSIVTGSMPEAELAQPTIVLTSSGLVTASVEQDEGYVAGGVTSRSVQLRTAEGYTVMPGASEKTAVIGSTYVLGDIKVAGDPDLLPQNIAAGKNIFGVDGTGGVPVSVSVLEFPIDPGPIYFFHNNSVTQVNPSITFRPVSSCVGSAVMAFYSQLYTSDVTCEGGTLLASGSSQGLLFKLFSLDDNDTASITYVSAY